MKSNEGAFAAFLVVSLMGCAKATKAPSSSSSNNNSGSSGSTSNLPESSPTNPSVLPSLTGANVLALSVNGSQCSANSYPNKPCVSVTVCTPGTSTCQTIND